MHQGFTLLELSIVLVIIGLIIGGITAGQELIRSAELNSVISDVNKYKVAVNTFKLKYNALPGDMDNATAYWGEAHATPATCRTTVGTGTQTCDGDGNGRIELTATSYEHLRALQHIGNAEILSHTANGATVMESAIESGVGGHFVFGQSNYANIENLTGNSGVSFSLGDITGAGVAASIGDEISGFTGPDAKSIDDKADDGSADTGKILAAGCNVDGIIFDDFVPDCPTSNCTYDLSGSQDCHMLFYE